VTLLLLDTNFLIDAAGQRRRDRDVARRNGTRVDVGLRGREQLVDRQFGLYVATTFSVAIGAVYAMKVPLLGVPLPRRHEEKV
jgi:hypothetical protein